MCKLENEPERSEEVDSQPSGFAHVTAEDFAAGCEAPIAASRKVYCQCLGSLYQKTAQDAESAGNERGARVYRLLAAVTQIHFKPNDKAEPYGAMFALGIEAILNVPVRVEGRRLGTLNLCGAEGSFGPEEMARARELAEMLVGVMGANFGS